MAWKLTYAVLLAVASKWRGVRMDVFTVGELKKSCSASANFGGLEDFFSGEYQQVLNKSRIKVVHYRQEDTDFFCNGPLA